MHANNISVLVTRPDPLAEPLIQALKNIGANVYHFPVLKIKLLSDNQHVIDAIKHLTQYHWQIFVSKNAVAAVMPQIIRAWTFEDLSQLNWAAVGAGTAEELENFMEKIQIRKTQNPNKSLSKRVARDVAFSIRPLYERGPTRSGGGISSTKSNIAGQAPFGREPEVLRTPFSIRIPIIYPKIDKGAKALSKALEHKIKTSDTVLEWCGDNPTQVWPGSKQVMCYQREKNPVYFEKPEKVDYIVVTSGTAMEYLEISEYHHSTLVVISERLANLAVELGFKGKVILAKGADEASIINAIKGDLI